jgi:branched-chain amino acid transport system ATP-binding protein
MTAPASLLAFESLSVGYGDEPIVRDFTASIPAGSITTIIGPNGAGKSTLLKAVYGVNKYFGGKLIFEGRAIEKLTPRERLTLGIGFVPQGRCNFPLMTVRENLDLGAFTLRGPAIQTALERVLGMFPLLKAKLNVLAGNLSGGEQQILETAMVLESWTSRRSACRRPTRTRSSRPSPTCAGTASRCWWWSRTPTARCRSPTPAS